MDALVALGWLKETAFATLVREHGIVFPLLESFHVLSVAFFLGTMAVVDLHLIGARLAPAIGRPIRSLLMLAWGAFACAAMTGVVMFCSDAIEYFNNGMFRIKILFMVFGAINALGFHVVAHRRVQQLDQSVFVDRLAGVVSLTLWVAVMVCGRWVGFVPTN